MADDPKKESEQVKFPNPFEIMKELYFAAEDALSSTAREAASTKSYTQMIDSMLENYLVQHKLATEWNNQYFSNLPVASKKDVARIAELIVSLEDKIDQIENGFINHLSAVVQSLSVVSDHMLSIKDRVDPEISGDTPDPIVSLAKRVEGLEQSMQRMEKTLKNIEKSLNSPGTATSPELKTPTEPRSRTKKQQPES